ncbi:MAG: FecR domain-containing protein [Gammaproteobacteria bacterium]
MNSASEAGTDRTVEEAAAWFTRHREADLSADERSQFAQWIAASPQNVREYLAVAEMWGGLAGAEPWPSQSASELIALARSASNVVSFPTAPAAAARPVTEAASSTRRWAAWAAAVLVAVAISASAFFYGPADWFAGRKFSTVRGEQRSLVLSDGSVVQLNTLTRAVIRFSQKTRRIELPEGEAFFRVAHDASRPFEVVTPFAIVRAVGTEFDVYSRERGTHVAVVEGRVRVGMRNQSAEPTVMPAAGPGSAAGAGSASVPEVVLGPRESLSIDAAGVGARLAVAKPQSTTAWIQRRLEFDDERLDHVVEEFNRYNRRQLSVTDPKLASLRIIGVFNADDPDALVKYLETIQHVTAVRDENGATTLQLPGAGTP